MNSPDTVISEMFFMQETEAGLGATGLEHSNRRKQNKRHTHTPQLVVLKRKSYGFTITLFGHM